MDLDVVRNRLLKLIEDRDTDLKAASLKIGRNAAYLHQFIYRGTPKILPESERHALAKFLKVDESDLRHRRVPPRKRRTSSRATQPTVVAPDLSGIKHGFVRIPEIDVRASAGPGAINSGLEEAKATWLFPEQIVRHEFRTTSNELRMITVEGDSMEPLLSTGDRIVVDTSQTIPVPPGIFVVWDGMGLVTKRVEHIPNSDPPKVLIKSVNESYKEYERTTEEINVVGRVVWMARRL